MIVTALNPIRKGRIALHLDGSYHCPLHREAARQLKPGQELDDQQLDELLRISALIGAKERALVLLSYRPYSRVELYDKLAERDGEEAAAAAVERMLELGYLNDEDYALRYAGERLRKGLAPGRVARELAEKGVDRELAEDALSRWEEEPEQAIARVVKRKYLRAIQDEKGLRRAQNALLRLGYRHGDIRAAIEHLLEDESYYEDNI